MFWLMGLLAVGGIGAVARLARTVVALAVIALSVLALLVAVVVWHIHRHAGDPDLIVSPAQITTASGQLAALRVSGSTGARSGTLWPAMPSRVDGCRLGAVLRRQANDPVVHDGCVRASGVVDPFTGAWVAPFTAGRVTLVVTPSQAADRGAASWTAGQRRAFVNDPLNLVVVATDTARDKGDQGPDGWLSQDAWPWQHPATPKGDSGRCNYAVSWTRVASKYHLSITPKDRSMLASAQSKCS